MVIFEIKILIKIIFLKYIKARTFQSKLKKEKEISTAFQNQQVFSVKH
jgi:hypothetical protein